MVPYVHSISSNGACSYRSFVRHILYSYYLQYIPDLKNIQYKNKLHIIIIILICYMVTNNYRSTKDTIKRALLLLGDPRRKGATAYDDHARLIHSVCDTTTCSPHKMSGPTRTNYTYTCTVRRRLLDLKNDNQLFLCSMANSSPYLLRSYRPSD